MRASRESEQIVLGSLMHDRDLLDDMVVTARDFYSPEHERLYQLIAEEIRKGNVVDLVSVGQRLAGNPIPGVDAAYLHTIYSSIATAVEGLQHARIVSGLAQLRRVGEAGIALQQMAEEADWESAEAILDDAKRSIDEAESTATAEPVRTFQQALIDATDVWKTPKLRETTSTGWSDLDEVLNGGWRPSQLTILGARPAVGKSVIAACAAVQAAESKGVAFFNLEMDEHEVVNRMTANRTDVLLGKFEKGILDAQDWTRVNDLVDSSFGGNLFLDSRPRIPTIKIRAQVRKWSRIRKPSLVIVDYLQLIEPSRKSDNRERQVSQIAEDLKVLAKEMKTHVLALAQVNRGAADRKPAMSDLRESGALEAHADNVILLHRDDELAPGEIELMVEKNRHGATRGVDLAWQPHISKATSF